MVDELVGNFVCPCNAILLEAPVTQGSIPAACWQELAHDLRTADCDGLLISCAGIQVAAVLDAIEQDFGRPVIASNQALVWQCLRLLACGIVRLGMAHCWAANLTLGPVLDSDKRGCKNGRPFWRPNEKE
jgi:hypothetical protein